MTFEPMNGNRKSKTERNVYVDFLRCLSILSVLIAHRALSPILVTWLPEWVSANIFRGGYYGVSIFFVISGFLITTTTLKRCEEPRRIDPKFFYVMRVGRILPGLALSLSVIAFCAWMKLPGFVPPDPWQTVSGIYNAAIFQYHVFFLHGGGGPGMDPLAVYWSLSIEEMFYVVFPPICVLTLSERGLVRVLCVPIVIGLFYRNAMTNVFDWWGACDLLSIGCITAIIARRLAGKVSRPIMRTLQAIGLAGILLLFVFVPWVDNYRFGPTAMGLSAAVFLFGSDRPSSRISTSALSPFALIGFLSYELYISHITLKQVFSYAVEPLQLGPYTHDILQSVLILGFAFLLSRAFTEPANRAVRRFYAKRIPGTRYSGPVRLEPEEAQAA